MQSETRDAARSPGRRLLHRGDFQNIFSLKRAAFQTIGLSAASCFTFFNVETL